MFDLKKLLLVTSLLSAPLFSNTKLSLDLSGVLFSYKIEDGAQKNKECLVTNKLVVITELIGTMQFSKINHVYLNDEVIATATKALDEKREVLQGTQGTASIKYEIFQLNVPTIISATGPKRILS